MFKFSHSAFVGILFAVLLTPFKTFAFNADLNFFFLTDSLETTATTSRTSIFYDIALMLDLNKKGTVSLGWSYDSVSISDEATSTTDFDLTEMGPKFNYYFDKGRVWGTGVVYNLISNATYNPGTAQKWRGGSYKIDFFYTPPITDELYIGVKLNYYVATYTEAVSSTTLTTISYTKSIIYPSLTISYRM